MALHVMDEANHCLGCKVPRCQQGCPIHTNIPEVIRLLKANKLDEAYALQRQKGRHHRFRPGGPDHCGHPGTLWLRCYNL